MFKNDAHLRETRSLVRGAGLSLSMVAAALVLGVQTYAPEAEACGGFFCSAQLPVNQAAERIIFVSHEDESVTAVIQIQYQGPSEEFSWVLPVPGVPDVNVSSNVAFTRLQNATNPQYILTTEIEGECGQDFFPAPSADGDFSGDGDGGDGDGDGGGGVTVVGGGSVGPYDYEVIAVDPELDDPADVAIAWLTENGYDVGELGPDVLRPYLEEGLNLLAFRLQKDASAGSIRPVVMRWYATSGGQAAGGNPSIPIRPTAVAANDDMGVLVWNVGPFRSVPANYRSLVLNDALINWFSPGANYNDVVNIAADEAGGHGFVTEMAGPTSEVDDVVWNASDESTWSTIRTEADWSDNVYDLFDLLWWFAGWDGLADAADAHLMFTDGGSGLDFTQCPTCYTVDVAASNLSAFVDAIEEDVIAPMKSTQDLLVEREYVTRLYTTMSADEMTEDPRFGFNPVLGDYDNVHTATRIVECNPMVSTFDAPWRTTLPSGLFVRGEGQTWPYGTDDGMPANLQVLQDNGSGQPDVITDNAETVSARLEELNPSPPPPGSGAIWEFLPFPGGGNGEGGMDCACVTSGPRAASLGGLVSAGLVLGLLGRRRARRDVGGGRA